MIIQIWVHEDDLELMDDGKFPTRWERQAPYFGDDARHYVAVFITVKYFNELRAVPPPPDPLVSDLPFD